MCMSACLCMYTTDKRGAFQGRIRLSNYLELDLKNVGKLSCGA